MNRNWSLADLTVQFPEITDRHPAFRCSQPVGGRGRWLKQSVDGRRRQFGDVALHAEPGESLEVRLHHSWPTEVDAEEAEALDTGLLRGLIHALLRPPYHVDGCLIVTDSVGYEREGTTPVSVTFAASLAMVDLLRKGGWDCDDTPSPAVAKRA